MLFNSLRKYARSLANSVIEDIEAYFSRQIESLPKLVAAEVAKLLVELKNNRIEPAKDAIVAEAAERLDLLRADYPVLAVTEPFILEAVRDRLGDHPRLSRLMSTYGSVKTFLNKVDDEQRQILTAEIADFAADRIEALLDRIES